MSHHVMKSHGGMHIAKWKKPVWERCLPCDSIIRRSGNGTTEAVKGPPVSGGEGEGVEGEKGPSPLAGQRPLSSHCPSFPFNRILIGQIIPQNKDSNPQPVLQLTVPQDSIPANGAWEEVMRAPSSPFPISSFLPTRMERLSRAIVGHVDKQWVQPQDKRNSGP